MDKARNSVRTARIFEFYVRYIWPIHRIFVRDGYSARCRTCGASNRMIPLSPSGICEVCIHYRQDSHNSKNSVPEEREDLNQILESHQGKGGNQYDALILFSGGKDSTYMIKRIQRDYPKLRLLALTVDNGFMSPVAKENVEQLVQKLKIDHLYFRPNKEFYDQLFRYTLTHLNEDGGYGTVDFSDGEALLDIARNLASEKEIPLLLCGYSRYQVQNGLRLNHFESPVEKEQADRTETAGIPLSRIFPSHEPSYWWKGSLRNKNKIARLIFPLYAWNLEEEDIKDQVRHWGLLQSGNQSPIVTNHRLVALIGVVDVHKFGYASFEKEFCRMIREGKADRSHWQPIFEFLEYTARTGLFVKPIVLQSLDELGLSLEHVRVHFRS